MIIKEEQSNVTIIGDIQENKVSIDPKNLEYITTLLSSNLYSNPEESFMREIISNAWDSHVEAGTTDKAVLVVVEEKWLSIRDFGTGLSPERFNEIYKFIGSSTKRNDNTQLGGFGIGRMSALACSNSCNITSYYNGKQYDYIMIKDGNSININLVMESDTTEDNGLKVSIPINSASKYVKSLYKLVFFPNVYIESKLKGYYYSAVEEYNNTKIKSFNNFSYCDKISNHYILLGNVLYPLDIDKLDKKYKELLLLFMSRYYYNIVPKFKIGEITITPNRENILYSASTIQTIENRIQEMAMEIMNLFKNSLQNNYDNILEYNRVVSNPLYYDVWNNTLLSDGISVDNSLSIGNYLKLCELVNITPPTYKGVQLNIIEINKIRDSIKLISNISLPKIISILAHNGKFYNSSNFTYECNKIKTLKNNILYKKSIVIVPKDTKLVSSLKSFIKSSYSGRLVIMHDISLEEFKLYMLKILQSAKFNNYEEAIVEEFYNEVIAKAHRLNPNGKEYEKYKNELKEEKKASKNISLTPIRVIRHKHNNTYTYGSEYKCYDIKEAIKHYNNTKEKDIPYVVTNSNNEYLKVILDIARIKKYDVITMPKKYLEYAKDLIGYIDADELLKFENPLIKAMYTLFNNNNDINYKDLELLNRYSAYFTPIQNTILNTYMYYRKRLYEIEFSELYGYIKSIPLGREYDPYILNICNVVNNMVKQYDTINNCILSVGIAPSSVACTFFMMKNKCKIPYTKYKSYLNSCLKIK